MKYLLLLSILSLMPQAFAQGLLWPDKCAKVISLKAEGNLAPSIAQHEWIKPGWYEIEALIAEQLKVPSVKISLEYVNYRSGDEIVSHAEYAPDCFKGPFREDDDKLKALYAKSKAQTLTKDDFTGPKWIHLVQAMDREEVNCLALSKVDGKLGGCADQWQGGLTEDKVVCLKNKTYLKCHVECMEKIYERKVDVQPGFCPEVE